ncbi:hypothetical protein F5888DRAFT_1869390 [Russula emetica]|nr:hypothetical protein F5888DRAFT_1869390 [Russula emetica]
MHWHKRRKGHTHYPVPGNFTWKGCGSRIMLPVSRLYIPTASAYRRSDCMMTRLSLGIALPSPGSSTACRETRRMAYNILLGQPFDVLTQLVIRNCSDENQTVTIPNPNTGQKATILTISRSSFSFAEYSSVCPTVTFGEVSSKRAKELEKHQLKS